MITRAQCGDGERGSRRPRDHRGGRTPGGSVERFCRFPGVIGARLPLHAAAGPLPRSRRCRRTAAPMRPGIATTDTPKVAAAGAGFTVGGMAKGSGMIHPDLATMLSIVTTGYPLSAAGRSTSAPGGRVDFNRSRWTAAVDQRLRDPACERRQRRDPRRRRVARALNEVCADLRSGSSLTAKDDGARRDQRDGRDRRRAGEGDRSAIATRRS